MSTVHNLAHNDAQFDPSHEKPQPLPGLHLVLPGAAVLLTLGLFGYAIAAGNMRDPSVSSATKTGDFSPQAGWINNLAARLSLFGSESLSPPASLTATVLPQFVVATITGSGPANMRLALSTPVAGHGGKALGGGSHQAALNALSIEFPGNSAKISHPEFGVIKRAAEIIRVMPEGTVVELIGYIAATSASQRGEALAQARADAVFKALVRAGVKPAMLSSRGYGSASVASSTGAEMEGRSSTVAKLPQHNDRRVDFRVVLPQR